jgi:hypothetical protein
MDLRAMMSGTWEPWFRTLLRACTPVLGQDCAREREVIREADLDRHKVRANDMHLSLNAREFPDGAKGVPIWIRVCQRTEPLVHVLEGLRSVRGIDKSLLLVTIDRDRMEHVLNALLMVDFMQVPAYECCFCVN